MANDNAEKPRRTADRERRLRPVRGFAAEAHRSKPGRAERRLLPHHRRLLEERGVGADVIAARGYWSATEARELRLLGFSEEQCRVPALVIPVHSADEPEKPAYHVIRPDSPRRDAEGGKPRKYDSPPKHPQVVDVPPALLTRWPNAVHDPRLRLFVAEGPIKADALVTHGIAAVGIQGVSAWRGKLPGGGKGAINDVREIRQDKRELVLAFDSDVTRNPRVHRDLADLGAYLERQSLVSAVLLPEPNGEKVGPDDFLAKHGTAADLLALVEPLEDVLRKVRPPLPDYSLADLENEPLPEALVEGLVYERSSHLFAGAAKAGKSYLAAQLAACLASGTPFLGSKTKPAKVRIVSLEMTGAVWRGRLRAVAHDVTSHHRRTRSGPTLTLDEERLRLTTHVRDRALRIDLMNENDYAALTALIRSSGDQLVFLDTFYRFAPNDDPNSTEDMGKVWGRINDLVAETGVAVVVIDHAAKGEHLGPIAHTAVGSQMKGGAANVIMRLQRTGSDKPEDWRFTLVAEGHYGRGFERHYRLPLRDDGKAGFGCVACSAADAADVKIEALEAAFREHGARDADDHPMFPSQTALIEALREAGLIRKDDEKGAAALRAIHETYCAEPGATTAERPIATRLGKKAGTRRGYTWASGPAAPAPKSAA